MLRPTTLLAGVLVVLALLVVPYLRPWVSQRQDLAAQKQEVADLRRQVAQLAEERRRWDDPAYVRAQAAERLNFVMPGQTRYTLLDDAGAGEASRDPRRPAESAARAAGRLPWYGSVWESARTAGGAAASTDPASDPAR
jgi:cell division protein FtsB